MPNAARQLIDSFEALAEQEEHEVLSQFVRRLIDKSYPWLTDEELTGVANLLFQEYDRREDRE